MIKYCMMAGHVLSKSGDYHYISPEELIQLYRLNAEECVTAPLERKEFKLPPGTIALFPKSNGDYRLPKRGKTNDEI